MSYSKFLASKDAIAASVGIAEPAFDASHLFPFQRDLVRWALRRGRAALFADTGLGKSRMQLTWADAVARATGGKALILAPLAVASQTVREGAAIGIDVTYARSQAGATGAITIANYEMLQHFDPREFTAVVLDECFAAGTPVEVVDVNGIVTNRPIDLVRAGDRIVNASGIDTVSDVHRREVPYAVRVRVAGQEITASPNHPFFTRRGWVSAQDLEPGDYALEAAEAVRMVRGEVLPEVASEQVRSVLRQILLSEMAHEATGTRCEGAHAGDRKEARGVGSEVVGDRVSGSGGWQGSCPQVQSDESTRGSGEGLPPIESHEARTFSAWGKRSSIDVAADGSADCAWTDMGDGVCRVSGPTGSGVSDALQARLGAARATSRYRGGWVLASQPEGTRQEEGREAGFARVDGIEVLEQGHPELDRIRDADGKLYFYDLGGTRHPSFSVGGILVHNSSCLKDYTSSTRTAIIEAFAATPYRLACTATPSPNDFTELGNHAEFLGIMRRVEMLSQYFAHDGGSTQDWTLKGHAKEAFWRWVCSWACLVKRPSDLGYDDAGYDLPALNMHEHIVPATQEQAHAQGFLFAKAAAGLTEQRQARKASMSDRVKLAIDIVAAEPDEAWVVWCELNDESDALAEGIPGAIEVRGSQKDDVKEALLTGFASSAHRIIVTKPSIAGFGLNWQHSARVVFVGITHSFEQFYQAVRRQWRFGQARPVECHIITSEIEGSVLANLRRKEADAAKLAEEMRRYTAAIVSENIRSADREQDSYEPTMPMMIPQWMTSETATRSEAFAVGKVKPGKGQKSKTKEARQ
jgi:hypothetical protein